MKKSVPFLIAIIISLYIFYPTRENKNLLAAAPQYPSERLEWRHNQKAGPKNVKALRAAKREITRQLKDKSVLTEDAGISAWTEIGPHNIGGRVRAIAPSSDPNVIFVGTAGGGILKGTYNATTTSMSWVILDDFLSSLAISCMEIDYSGSQDIIYAGTGEIWACRPTGCTTARAGSGILRSINGGSTWTNILLPTGFSNFWITEIAVDHNNPGTLYVLSNHSDQNGNSSGVISGAIHKSTNYGATWQSSITTLNNGNVIDFVCDIKIDPTNSSNIIVTTWDGNLNGSSKIIRSTNGGVFYNLEESTIGERTELCFSPSTPDTIYYSRSRNSYDMVEIGWSTDSGNSWNSISTLKDFDGQATYNNTLWVDPLEPDVVFSGGIDIYKSDDAGMCFNKKSDWRDYHDGVDIDSDGNIANSLHADHHVAVSAFNYSSTNRRVWFGNDGGVANTEDIHLVSTNDKWNLFSLSGYSVTQFVGGDISNGGTRFVGGAQDNSFSVGSTNGDWYQPVTGDGGYAKISKFNYNTIFSTTQNGKLFRSLDGGSTFCNIAAFDGSPNPNSTSTCIASDPWFTTNDSPAFYAPLEMDHNNSSTLLLGAQRLWVSQDNGETWGSFSEIRTNTSGTFNFEISAIDVGTTNSQVAVVGYQLGRIYRTENLYNNPSPNWARLDNNTPLLPDSLVTSVAINPFNSDEMMIAVAGYSQRSIWYSNDKGVTWENRSLNFDMQVNTITWHPENANLVYIGTDIGIFASENKGVDWSVNPLYTSAGVEGPVYVEVSELTWQKSKNKLCAFTHGRGVWLSNEILSTFYVDKNYSGTETGSITQPFNTFTEAYNACYNGSEIIFLSAATHNDINSSLIVDKNIKITLDNGGNPVIIK